MKKKIIVDDFLMVDVIAITGTRDEAQKFINGLKIEQELSGIGYCAVIPDNGGFVVWLQDAKDFYSLLHECVHLVNFIFGSKGINTQLQNDDEAFAYYMAGWFRKLWRFYGNIKFKKGKK